MIGEGVLAYWFRLEPENHPEWIDWYIRDHMPSRLGTTFTGARCFQLADGSPWFMALYATPSAEALIAPAYLELLRGASEGDMRRRGWYLETTRGCCRKTADEGYGSGGVVGCIRYERTGDDEQAAGHFAAIAAALQAVNGIGRVFCMDADPAIRAKMDEARVTGHDDASADRAVVVECSSEADVEAAFARLEQMPEWAAVAEPTSVRRETYRLLYAIAK